MNPDFEVIVVGGGVAGLAAAISAREAGASVVVLEAQDHLGGSSALSGGHLYAAGTRYQRERGIVDHPDDLFEYFSTLNQFRVDPALVRTFAMNAPAAIEWAIAHGAEVGAPDRCDNSPVFRGHRVVGYGAGLMAALERSARSLGVEIVFRTRVRRLVLEGERVTGVEVDGQPFRAGAVVVATGGFAQNRELIERHYPEALSGGDWVASHANPASQGDALELGQQAGADLTGENRGLFVVRPRFRQYGESKRFIYVNERGRRFINEAAYYSTVAHAIRRQGGRAFMVFDDRTRSFFNGDYDRSAPFRAEDLGLDWIGTTPLARRTARMVSAPTLGELGSAAGLDPAVVEGTVASYNSGCEAGEDAAFFKEPQHLHPIDQAPYYAVEVRPAAVVLTGYGMRIDTQSRVVRPAGEVIPGLYAAGEAVGNYYGEVYVASGSSLTGGIVFGTRAGADASAVARTLQAA